MDVRCDRCQTEYELDDESVAGPGASVQCTTCGHTFVVARAGSVNIGTTPPAAMAGIETPGPTPRVAQSHPTGPTSPPAPEWVLATEEGQTHRLRDLTTLQKWVVERRVSRADRVSHRGGAWRPLSDLDELRPFFDVVEQADRQSGVRAAESRAGRSTQPATPRKLQAPVRASHMSRDLDDDDVLSSRPGTRRREEAERFLDTDIGTDDDLSLALKPRRTGLKIFGGLVVLGLAAGAWYIGFREPHGFRLASGVPIPATAAPAATPSPAATPAPAPSPGTPAAPTVPAPAAAAPVAAPAPAPAPAATPTPTLAPATGSAPAPAPEPAAAAPAAPAPAAAPTPAVAEKPAPVPEAARPAPSPAAAATSAAPKSYERLVSEGDHFLENGQTTKAQKLYDEALRLQPQGVAAMTGSAYVLMDKRRPLAAIGLFKQVLSNAPHFAPALFGLGEAYRSQGDGAQAIEAYKNYLEQSPTGPDAPAARRQIKELSEAAAARPSNPGPSAVVPQSAN